MKRVIRLAKKGIGRVSPNPLVGALLVKNDQIIAEGYHENFGGPHAEINAISKVPTELLRNSTLYINLEPCIHFGKTPPCTEAILKSGIRKVVIGHIDPNPLVDGKGLQQLRKNGIVVKSGILEKACLRLNEAYIKFIIQNKPFITLKIAQTLDGKIATTTGESRWITSEKSRKVVHRMRKEHDSILVGINTVLDDDPDLTVRPLAKKYDQPRRIILDSRLRISADAKVLKHADIDRTIIVTTEKARKNRIQAIKATGATIWVMQSDFHGYVPISALCKKLAQEKIISLFVEGGSKVLTSFYQSGEADKIVIFIAPKIFGSGLSAFQDLKIRSPQKAITCKTMKWQRIANDIVFEGRL